VSAPTTARPDPARTPGGRPPARRVHRRPPPWAGWRGPAWLDGPMSSSHLVLGAAGLLLAIGLVMVFSASSIEAALDDRSFWEPAVDQVVFAGIGLVALLVAVRLPVGAVRRWSPIALLVVALLLVLVLIPGIGVEYNGSQAWIDLGFMNFQPSELAKLVLALWGAHVLALRERYLTTRSLLVPVLPVFGVLAALLLAEPDFGAVVTLALVLVGLLWAGGMRLRWFAAGAAAGAGVVAVVAILSPVRRQRLTAFLDPFADMDGAGFQAVRGFYALATGGWSGVGLGNSAMKWNQLPEAESDYIFAIVGEELGFLGCLVVITLYGVLAYAGFRIARRVADRFIQLATVAITVWLISQAAMNMGYVVGLLPVTGVTLPLISKGGTSLVLTLFVVGLLARFARYEPAAIEAERARTRGRLARWLLPVPSTAVERVRPRRRPDDVRPRRQVPGGRTVVAARGPRPGSARSEPGRAGAGPRREEPRGAAPRRVEPRGAAPRRVEPRRADPDRRPARPAERGAASGDRRIPLERRAPSAADRRPRDPGTPSSRRQPSRGGR
jgi:cell division protein FtsW